MHVHRLFVSIFVTHYWHVFVPVMSIVLVGIAIWVPFGCSAVGCWGSKVVRILDVVTGLETASFGTYGPDPGELACLLLSLRVCRELEVARVLTQASWVASSAFASHQTANTSLLPKLTTAACLCSQSTVHAVVCLYALVWCQSLLWAGEFVRCIGVGHLKVPWDVDFAPNSVTVISSWVIGKSTESSCSLRQVCHTRMAVCTLLLSSFYLRTLPPICGGYVCVPVCVCVTAGGVTDATLRLPVPVILPGPLRQCHWHCQCCSGFKPEFKLNLKFEPAPTRSTGTINLNLKVPVKPPEFNFTMRACQPECPWHVRRPWAGLQDEQKRARTRLHPTASLPEQPANLKGL